jgi:hypothetical protein
MLTLPILYMPIHASLNERYVLPWHAIDTRHSGELITKLRLRRLRFNFKHCCNQFIIRAKKKEIMNCGSNIE